MNRMPGFEAISTTLALLAGLATAACGGAGPGAAAAPAVAEQIDLGESVFRRRCAACHGPGGRAPKVTEAGALPAKPPKGAKMRTETLATAAELLAWTEKKMPPGMATELTPAEHAAVVAYMLAESGYKLGAQPLDTANAAAIKLR